MHGVAHAGRRRVLREVFTRQRHFSHVRFHFSFPKEGSLRFCVTSGNDRVSVQENARPAVSPCRRGGRREDGVRRRSALGIRIPGRDWELGVEVRPLIYASLRNIVS